MTKTTHPNDNDRGIDDNSNSYNGAQIMTVDAGYFVSLVTWVNVASVTFPSQFFVLNQFLLFSSLEFFVSERIKILKANNSSKGGKSFIPRKICQSANLSDCEILSRRFRSFLTTASPVGSVGWNKNFTRQDRTHACSLFSAAAVVVQLNAYLGWPSLRQMRHDFSGHPSCSYWRTRLFILTFPADFILI